MTIEEAREYWSKRLERAAGYSDELWDAEERHAHKEYIDALKHAVTALAICREREETAKKPKTVRHGRWIDTPLPNSRVAKCSLCGFWQRTNGDDKTGKHLIHNAVYRYCAGCGAKMDGGADNEHQV